MPMGELHARTPACCTAGRPRVLLLCSPCMGHLIPFTELARRLVTDHGLAATLLFAAATYPPLEQFLALAASVPAGVDLVALPAPPASISLLLLHLPDLDDAARASGEEFGDAGEPIRLPGCVAIHAHDLPPSMRADRSSDMYAGFLAMARDVRGVDGILVNTFRELEPAVGDDSMVIDGVTLPVYPVGPLVWTRPVVGTDRDHKCLMRWLDRQPRGSVVYVSFGSGGTLTLQQTTELAFGLELSQCRFIWAVKRPDQSSTTGAFLGSRQGEETALDFLPEGFIERTRYVGLLMTSTWAPQTAILEHASVGCFMTHCGWNSTLESITNGVPMVAWPLYAEQSMNAAMLEVQVRVAVRVKVGADQFVRKEEVAAAIQRVMEGDESERMRKRVSKLKDRSVHALSNNGCSTHALAQTANKWKCFASGI